MYSNNPLKDYAKELHLPNFTLIELIDSHRKLLKYINQTSSDHFLKYQNDYNQTLKKFEEIHSNTHVSWETLSNMTLNEIIQNIKTHYTPLEK